MFTLGTELTIHYPTTTHVRYLHIVKYLRKREIIVRGIRDLFTHPLTTEEFLRRPFVRRSRWLVKAWDPTRSIHRQFYLGSTLEFPAPGVLRIGIYDSIGRKPVEALPGQYEPSVPDRKQLVRIVIKLSDARAKRKSVGCIGVFCDDLRLIA